VAWRALIAERDGVWWSVRLGCLADIRMAGVT
jgi:hypothetical protein